MGKVTALPFRINRSSDSTCCLTGRNSSSHSETTTALSGSVKPFSVA